MTKSKKRSKTRQNFDIGMKPKSNSTSFHMFLDHCYAFGWLLQPVSLKKKFVEEGDHSWPNFAPPWMDLVVKKTTLVRDHEHFIPTKFRKYPSIGSEGKADYAFPYIYMH